VPVVPITSAPSRRTPTKLSDIRPQPPEPFALMAAAQMHSEGRLLPDVPKPVENPLNVS
jgi:hypothetical protein